MTDKEESKTRGGFTSRKSQIICKFFIMGNCIKNDRCEYLHQKIDKSGQNFSFQNYSQIPQITECPLYALGFCKLGPMCKFSHTKSEKAENTDTISNNNDNLEENPTNTNSNNSEVLKQQFDEKLILPTWYLEYLFEKPIHLVFQDFEVTHKEETDKIKDKVEELIGTKNRYDNNFIGRNYYQNYNYSHSHDIYAPKKNAILDNLNLKVRYFFIRCKNSDFISFSMENNILILSKQTLIKLREARKSCDDVILIIFDNYSKNFCGYCKYKYELNSDDTSIYIHDILQRQAPANYSVLKIEYLWKTKLSYSKVELLQNPLNEGEQVTESKDGQEIAIDIGYYMCRLMIKRLTKDEVQDYMNQKREYEEKTFEEPNYSSQNLISKKASQEEESTKIINIHNIKNFSLKPKENSLNLLKDNIDTLLYDNIQNTNNNIIVTNISNLQVNISQNSYTSNISEKGKSSNYSRDRDRERNKDRDYNIKSGYYKDRKECYTRKYRRRSISDSESSNYNSHTNYKYKERRQSKRQRSSSSKSASSLDSEATVVISQENLETPNKTDSQTMFSSKKRNRSNYEEKLDLSFNVSTNLEKAHIKQSSVKPNLSNKETTISKPLSATSQVATPSILSSSQVEPKTGENKLFKNKLFSNAMQKLVMGKTNNAVPTKAVVTLRK